jgi:hypothetical protein
VARRLHKHETQQGGGALSHTTAAGGGGKGSLAARAQAAVGKGEMLLCTTEEAGRVDAVRAELMVEVMGVDEEGGEVGHGVGVGVVEEVVGVEEGLAPAASSSSSLMMSVASGAAAAPVTAAVEAAVRGVRGVGGTGCVLCVVCSDGHPPPCAPFTHTCIYVPTIRAH